MKKAFLFGLVILVGTSLLLAGCSSINGTNSGQPQAQPTLASSQAQTQAPLAQTLPSSTPDQALAQTTPTGVVLDQSANDADQALNDMRSTLQSIDISTPASTGDQSMNGVSQSANDADQSLNSLQQTVHNEPTP